MHDILDKYAPNDNGCKIKPAQMLSMMIMNIVVAAKPLYKVDEWLIEYSDGKAEEMKNAAKYNDYRMARSLDALFEADRHSLIIS